MILSEPLFKILAQVESDSLKHPYKDGESEGRDDEEKFIPTESSLSQALTWYPGI